MREANIVAHSAFQPELPAAIKTAEIIEKGSGEPPLRVLCLGMLRSSIRRRFMTK